jgi:Peptidase C10 family/Spi protease inhibitor/Secretion system C-terminal sorting domain
MKKNLLFTFFAVFSVFVVFAGKIDKETAQKVGFNFLNQKFGQGFVSDINSLRLSYTMSTNSGDCFYVFNAPKGFVMIAAEDAVRPVLAYSNNSAFRGDKMPDNVASIIATYKEQIEYAAKNQVKSTPENAQKWDNLKNNKSIASAARTTSVTPLLATTWDQSPNYLNVNGYYNDDCPYDAGSGVHCVTGCVATATAQVMKFWNWPTHGTGIHAYASTTYGTLSANFGSTTYDWASMPTSLSTHTPSVARLMSDVGIAVDMNYSPTESGAMVIIATSGGASSAEYALKAYFSYDPTLHGEQRSYYSDATWISMLEAELNAGRPIIYDGFGASGGHCFVFDGYDGSDNFFHVNWGWSGADDGYYGIDALNPTSVGTGGGSGGFNSNQEAIFGVKPATTSPSVTDSLIMYSTLSNTATSSSIFYLDTFSFYANIANPGSATFTGDICDAAFDSATGTFITIIDSAIGVTIAPGTYVSAYMNCSTGSLPMVPGTYIVGMFYRPTGGSWIAVNDYAPYYNFQYFSVYNHNFIDVYGTPLTPSPTTFVQGSSGTVSANFINNSTSTSWMDSINVSLYNLDGTYAQNIQTIPTVSLDAGTYLSAPLNFTTPTITVAPGTYYCLAQFHDNPSTGPGWFFCGADYSANPITITVMAPPISPDIYESNNTVDSAYDLNATLTWVGDVAQSGTPGSNFHIVTDQDFYKITLPAGYNYMINARVNDAISTDDGLTYTTDAVWSYSTDGTTWSPVYNNTMAGTINLGSLSGGTVYFHCSPAFAGNTGTYLLKIGSITRTLFPVEANNIQLSEVRLSPNPTTEYIVIDLTKTNTTAKTIKILDMQGNTVLTVDGRNSDYVTIPVKTLAAGSYFAEIATESGTVRNKFTVL